MDKLTQLTLYKTPTEEHLTYAVFLLPQQQLHKEFYIAGVTTVTYVLQDHFGERTSYWMHGDS